MMPHKDLGLAPVIWVCLKIVYPYTHWLMILMPTKWLFHWGYTPFSDIPIYFHLLFASQAGPGRHFIRSHKRKLMQQAYAERPCGITPARDLESPGLLTTKYSYSHVCLVIYIYIYAHTHICSPHVWWAKSNCSLCFLGKVWYS